MKLLRALLLGTACAAAAAMPPAFAAPRKEQSERPIRTIAIVVNGEPLVTSTPPLVVGGRILLPLRDVFEALGIGVSRAGDTIAARRASPSARRTPSSTGGRSPSTPASSICAARPTCRCA